MMFRHMGFAIVCALAMPCEQATAAASARVEVSVTTPSVVHGGASSGHFVLLLDQTGGDFIGVPPIGIFTLDPGATIEFDVTWTITVSDDGLPVSYDGRPTNVGQIGSPIGCFQLGLTICGLSQNPLPQHEQAEASVVIGFVDTRSAPGDPNVFEHFGSRSGPEHLTTTADSFAESISGSGQAHIGIRNPDLRFSHRIGLFSLATTFVLAAPIPEPATWGLMLLGLPVMIPVLRSSARARSARRVETANGSRASDF